MSVLNATINRAITQPTIPAIERRISLTDNVKNEAEEDEYADVTDLDGASLSAFSRPSTTTRIGREKLRENLARRKYAKYQKERYEDDDAYTSIPGPSTGSSNTATREELTSIPQIQIEGKSKDKKGRLQRGEERIRRGQAKVKGILGWRKHHKATDGESEIDVLWENQRGIFLFGRPYYSAQSLLNFDRPAWTNQYNKSSPVDITNAQLPDPHWEWVWKTWYVDMSLDVDEQGWQYSFMFQTRYSWHGTHPWGYSFVRRRRWIRKRVRKHHHLPDGRVVGNSAVRDAHRLNADYFTIHPQRSRSEDSSYPPSTLGPQGSTRKSASVNGEDEMDSVDDIRILLQRLKRATMDREKINLVLRFMDDGGQDVHYLADEMPHIMSLLMYQYSRLQLLTSMVNKVDGSPSTPTSKPRTRPKHSRTNSRLSPPSSPPQSPSLSSRPRAPSLPGTPANEEQRHKNLARAVKVADEQIHCFEFWSDIRGIVQSGESLSAVDSGHGWDDTWRGVDQSGPGVGTGQDALYGKGKGKSRAE